jgi:hypothetical protein
MNDVFDAQLPTNSFDEFGTSPTAWTTVQVGGDVVYRGNEVVSRYNEPVGKAGLFGEVTGKLQAVPGSGCRGEVGSNDREQALWIFSVSACGTYGFPDLRIGHAGRTEPVGQIVLESNGKLNVSGGSGWLLRVDSALPETAVAN